MNSSERSKFESMVFALCKNEDGKASVRTLFEEIKRVGINPVRDPRLRKMVEKLEKMKPKANISLEAISLTFDQLKDILSCNSPLLMKILRNDLVVPEFEYLCEVVSEFYHSLRENMNGECASYIPQLARVPKEKWGISICTVDGQRFSIGDVTDKFTIQSTSKPITYSLTLEELGLETVHKYQGREPSGRMFNEIVLDHNNQPHNPMVNSGAIMSASILLQLVKPEMTMAEKYDFVYGFFKRMAGGEYLGFNNSVFLSERDTADRNFALAYFLRENMCFPPGNLNITNTLDFYFQCCSMEMTAESEAIIAATLANGGVCPTTGERVMRTDSVKNVLSLMLSCGLYNYSGDFAFKVGLPAKSGVSGALMLVVPNVMGICLWSPPLDEMGNSVRGVQFCEQFVKMYNFYGGGDEIQGGVSPTIDVRKNRYEEACQVIMHILMAASTGDETALKSAFSQGIDMNIGDYDGRTALHLVAAEGHIRCVRLLLDVCKVKHDPKDRWGQTPLLEAINFKHVKIAAIIRRHERSLRANKLKNNNNPNEETGEILWRKLVEKKFFKPNDKKNQTVKFEVKVQHQEMDISKRISERFNKSIDLETVKENDHNSVHETTKEEILEQESAAKIIQNKYRDMIKRRYDKSREAIRPLRIEVPFDSFPERESGLNVTPSSTSSLASSASSLANDAFQSWRKPSSVTISVPSDLPASVSTNQGFKTKIRISDNNEKQF